MATQYQQKIPIVEALQYTGSNLEEMIAFCPMITVINNRVVFAGSLEVLPGHWISKDTANVFYPQGEHFLSYYDPLP